jgi:carboxymethylenebutenolidase
MCFEPDAHPPIEPMSGAAYESGRLVLSSADGASFLAYAARAGIPGSPGVVVMPDVRGLFGFYEELADRFAERGFDAIAIDYFGRTAGLDDRGEDFDFWPHVQQTTGAGVTEDVAAAVAGLREGDEDRPIFTIGFCFGGSASWLQAAAGHGLAGVIGFYGRPTTAWPEFPAPADVASEVGCPVLGLFGGADESIPAEAIAAFGEALAAAGVERELHIYEGAPHSFFDRKADQYAEASADAWQRVLRFISIYG